MQFRISFVSFFASSIHALKRVGHGMPATGLSQRTCFQSWDHHMRVNGDHIVELCTKNNSSMVVAEDQQLHKRILMNKDGEQYGLVHCAEVCEDPHPAECKGCPCTPTMLDPVQHPTELAVQVDVKLKRRGLRSQNILIVGLGSGGQVHSLKAVIDVGMIRIIEIDENVIEASRKFFGLNATVVTKESLSHDLGTQIWKGDAEEGLQMMIGKFPEQFDIAHVDCMMKDGSVPAPCRSKTFYSSLHSLLKPNGSIYQWTWNFQTHEIRDVMQEYFVMRPNINMHNPRWVTNIASWLSATKSLSKLYNEKY